MRVPFSFLVEQFASPEPIFQKIGEFLKRCDFTLGEDVVEFEKRYARYCGAKHAVGVGSGTDALFLAMKAAGVRPGDEVITVPNSFIATTGAIVQAGARPVYIDVGDDLVMRCDAIEAAVTKRTRVVMPVHWAGYPADMEEICRIARKHDLLVIEDSCQALGARIRDKHVGTFGVAGAFSLHPIKPLHVWGDGGMIVTDSAELASALRLLRNHGLEGRDLVRSFGYNSRLDNVHAIVGNHVMDTLEDTIRSRVAHAGRYDAAFGEARFRSLLEVPPRRAGVKHIFHLYQLKVQRRDELLAHLQKNGVEAKVHYPVPLHLQPAASEWNYGKGNFPVTERQSEQTVTLPCHQYLSQEQIDYVIEMVAAFYRV